MLFRSGVLHLDLAVGHAQQRLGRPGVLGRGGHHRAEHVDGLLVLLLAIQRIGQPEARRVDVAAVRIALHEGRERCGTLVEVAGAQRGQRGLVAALLVRLGGEFLAVVQILAALGAAG